MLKLDSKIVLDRNAIESKNLCSRFQGHELATIGQWVWDGYNTDKQSRNKWEQRMTAAMDLALQVVKAKSYPWPDSANVAFPLVTIAALQFHARAYPTIVSGPEVIKCRVVGDDPTGEQKARADRVSCHMSWQLLEQDQSWEEQHDRLLINLPIVGCAFKKTRFRADKGYNCSELVLAKDLVMNYYAKSVDECERKTHVIPLYRNEIYERVRRGTFVDVLRESWYLVTPPLEAKPDETQRDRRTGQIPPAQADETTPFVGLEQHCSLDLDGDGYAEPYIITIEESTKHVLRIVTRFDRPEDVERTKAGKVIRINPLEYFTKYSFVPSPDGGIYDVGFGLFLGPLNESVNSLVNMMLDTGHLHMGGMTLLGRGAKIRGGVMTFSPFEMKRVDSTGDDLRKNIFQLQVGEPSAVLFNLLTLLINYTQRISGSTDIMVGENIGQNTPKGTADTLLEQGQKIYNSIFKRVWRGMKEEAKKLYVLNGMYLGDKVSYGQGQEVQKADYLGDPNRVVPAADPNIVSDAMNIQLATAVKQSAMTTPGYDKDAVEVAWLKALKVPGYQTLFRGANGQPPPEDPKVTIEKMRQAGADKDREISVAELQQDAARFGAELLEEQRMNSAEIMRIQGELQARLIDVQGDAEDRQVAVLQSQLAIVKARDETTRKRIDLILKGADIQIKNLEIDKARVQAQGARDKAAKEKAA